MTTYRGAERLFSGQIPVAAGEPSTSVAAATFVQDDKSGFGRYEGDSSIYGANLGNRMLVKVVKAAGANQHH
jgi:hypothetical protein